MNISRQSKSATPEFDIQEKLKSSGTHWNYLHIAQPHQDGFDYEFNTILGDEIEFAIYERCGSYFVLVDFFKNYDEACQNAKRIIDEHPDVKSLFSNRSVN